MTKEDRREITVKGFFLGLILFLSTLINLLINMDMLHLQIVRTSLIPIIISYCLLGIFIRWMVYRSTVNKGGFHPFSGTAIAYWILVLSTIFMIGPYWIPQVIQYIVVTNIATLLLIWLLNCIYLKNIATELNYNLKYYNQTIVQDLTRKPQTEDMFVEEIKNYCKKNYLFLEIIEHGIPAKIKIDNILYMVQLGQYYSIAGNLVYTLEFHNIISEPDNKSTL